MRFIGGSNRILDAYYDSPHGTFAVDISCSHLVPLEIWNQFKVRDLIYWQYNCGTMIPKKSLIQFAE